MITEHNEALIFLRDLSSYLDNKIKFARGQMIFRISFMFYGNRKKYSQIISAHNKKEANEKVQLIYGEVKVLEITEL